MQFRESPFTPTDDEQAGIDLFEDYLWHSSETCSECFSRIRDVGPRTTRQLEEPREKHLKETVALTIEINAWYERTDHGSQEHTPFDVNKRFGTCFCLECGSDSTANHRHKTLRELKPLASNIAAYTRDHTPITIDPERFAREIAALKRVPENQGWETEILALSFARARIQDSR